MTAAPPAAAYCNIMHADGAGTKSSLAYLYWKETGDLSVWRGIAQVPCACTPSRLCMEMRISAATCVSNASEACETCEQDSPRRPRDVAGENG
jgi:hypothetical protein